MTEPTANWNHSTKPSTFEVWQDGKRIYSGPYKAGLKLYQERLDYARAMKARQLTDQKTA